MSHLTPQNDSILSIDQSPMGRTQIIVVLICWMINMLDGFDVLVIAYTAPSIAQEWSVSLINLGIVFSAGLVGMTLGAMFLAPLADKLGRRRIILMGLGITGGAMVITSITQGFEQLVIARLITGLGIGALLGSLTALVVEYSSLKKRNTVMGIFHTGYPVGATLGGLLVAQLIVEYGWRSGFLSGGILTLLMIPVVIRHLPESLHYIVESRAPDALNKLNAILARMGHKMMDSLPTTLDHKDEETGLSGILAGQFRFWTLALWLGFFCSMLTLYFLQSWTPKIIVDAGLSLEKGIYTGIFLNMGGIFGMLIMGKISRSWGLRRSIIIFLSAGVVSMLVFASVTANPTLLLIVAFFMGLFVLGGFIGLYFIAALLYPTIHRSTGIGWAIGIGRLGAILGPYLAGVLLIFDLPLTSYYFILGLPLLIAAVAAFQISARQIEIKQ